VDRSALSIPGNGRAVGWGTVDEMEERVVAEREAEGRAGNAVERIAMPRTEPDHKLPIERNRYSMLL